MNRHFDDVQYYLKQAGKHATEGVKEELEPVEAKVREVVGKEKVPEPSRVEALQDDLAGLAERAEGNAKQSIDDAREQVRTYRER
jgi:uncharacterized protein YjbJ (UPF0337 family)